MRSWQAHSKREGTRSASRTRMARAAFGECLVEPKFLRIVGIIRRGRLRNDHGGTVSSYDRGASIR